MCKNWNELDFEEQYCAFFIKLKKFKILLLSKFLHPLPKQKVMEDFSVIHLDMSYYKTIGQRVL